MGLISHTQTEYWILEPVVPYILLNWLLRKRVWTSYTHLNIGTCGSEHFTLTWILVPVSMSLNIKPSPEPWDLWVWTSCTHLNTGSSGYEHHTPTWTLGHVVLDILHSTEYWLQCIWILHLPEYRDLWVWTPYTSLNTGTRGSEHLTLIWIRDLWVWTSHTHLNTGTCGSEHLTLIWIPGPVGLNILLSSEYRDLWVWTSFSHLNTGTWVWTSFSHLNTGTCGSEHRTLTVTHLKHVHGHVGRYIIRYWDA